MPRSLSGGILSFQQIGLDVHMQKNEVGPLPHTVYLKWIQGLRVRAKTIKPLEENIGINLHDLVLGNGFLDITPKAQAKKEKN